MIHAVIIDDEVAGRGELQELLREYCPQVKIMGTAPNAAKGVRAIRAYEPDLVFLDIEMPGGNGFDMLEKIGNIDFEIIFTTAYDKYAIRAIKFCALDYLLKPIVGEELAQAVEKAEKKIKNGNPRQEQIDILLSNLRLPASKLETIAIPDSLGYAFVPLGDIIRFESIAEKTCIYIAEDKPLMVNKPLKDYEELLGEKFFRIHHSHLINLLHARQYVKGEECKVIMSDGSVVEVSRRKRDEFLLQFTSL